MLAASAIADLLACAEERSPRAPARRRAAREALTVEERRRVAQRARLGHPPAVIARALGLTVPSVRRYLSTRQRLRLVEAPS